MKQSEKSIVLGGIVLLILAAFFTISIMVQFLNFGVTKEILLFFKIGQILFSAYGYSSILIPIFLFVAAISFFSVNFTKKRAVILGASLLPFYTVVATERICNKILPGSTEPVFALKLITSICICGLLITIEYLATGIPYDSLVSQKKKEKRKQEKISTISTSPSDLEVTQLDEVNSDNNFSVEVEADELLDDDIEIAQKEEVYDEKNEEYENEFSSEDIVENQIIEEEQPINVIFSRNEEFSQQDDEENKSEVIVSENDEIHQVDEEDESQLLVSDLIDELYQPNSDEENFLENPFADEEQIEEEIDESLESEDEEYKFQSDENEIKYDYNLEPEESADCMSEEERMNATVPLMNIQLGEEIETDEKPENSDEDKNDEEIVSSDDDFLDIDFNNVPNIEEQSSVPKDPLFQSAHSDLFIEEETVQENQFDENESEENDYEEVDFESADEIEFEEIDDNEEIEVVDFNESDDIEDIENQNDEDIVEQEIEPKVQVPVVQSVPKRQRNAPYRVPSEGLLTSYPDGEYWIIDSDTQKAAVVLKETLSEFKIEAEVTGIRKGPVITMFEILPAPGVKLNKIVALQDNIALRLAASSVRIVAPIPGKSAVGIEVPNKERAIVSFKELIETETAAYKKMAIPVVLGKDITGEAQLLDLAKTPHLLIAGSTGSGKSVCVNSMILSILYKRSPNEVKLILIDPKVVELKLYNDIPHLLTPVITEPKKAFQALQYCLCEMERRYALLDGMGVRDITSYNHRIVERNIATEKLPYIVVVIDEFADLMATTGKELESVVARLAAMSRAVGIHLVLATQRPSIDVITGLIKANIPTRIAFMVASKMDSRIIIDQVGAEKLLGRGDMLYASATVPFPVRIQGTFVSDSEVENVVDYVKQYGEPEYIDDEIFVEDDDDMDVGPNLFGDGEDPLYNKALEIVIQAGKASASYIQRRLKIGYNRAARLVEDMEARGIVGPANGSKPREIIHIP